MHKPFPLKTEENRSKRIGRGMGHDGMGYVIFFYKISDLYVKFKGKERKEKKRKGKAE